MVILGILCLVFVWEIFVPRSFTPQEPILYSAQKGEGQKDIAHDLKAEGIIKNGFFFQFYSLISGSAGKLQAGIYDVSPSMSIAAIIQKLVSGDIAKKKVVILEGWDTGDISKYADAKKLYTAKDITSAFAQDFTANFSFLKNKPKTANLEGYIFPDTYVLPIEASAQDLVKAALANFDKKVTPELRTTITKQHKTIFQIVTMASILEKEVPSLEDKKIVAGILWKRIDNGMPLQVDATINYITGKSDARAASKDTKINSLYNTYKYLGLPAGPISNPGMDSLLAAVYPTKSPYWYYLSADGTGQTVYSKTFADHSLAISKYLK